MTLNPPKPWLCSGITTFHFAQQDAELKEKQKEDYFVQHASHYATGSLTSRFKIE